MIPKTGLMVLCVVCQAPAKDLGFVTMRPYCSDECYLSVLTTERSAIDHHEEALFYVIGKKERLSWKGDWRAGILGKMLSTMSIAQWAKHRRKHYGEHGRWYDFIPAYALIVSIRTGYSYELLLKILRNYPKHKHPPSPENLAHDLGLHYSRINQDAEMFEMVYKESVAVLESSLAMSTGRTLGKGYALARVGQPEHMKVNL